MPLSGFQPTGNGLKCNDEQHACLTTDEEKIILFSSYLYIIATRKMVQSFVVPQPFMNT